MLQTDVVPDPDDAATHDALADVTGGDAAITESGTSYAIIEALLDGVAFAD